MSRKTKPPLEPKSSSRRIFEYIVAYKREHDGNSPSMRQISDRLELGYSTVFYQLRHLVKHNLIRLADDQAARGIEIVGGCWTLPADDSQAKPINIPSLSEAENKWLNDYYGATAFEPLHLDELADGSMTFAEVAKANITWYEDHTVEALHLIDTPPVEGEDGEAELAEPETFKVALSITGLELDVEAEA